MEKSRKNDGSMEKGSLRRDVEKCYEITVRQERNVKKHLSFFTKETASCGKVPRKR